MTSSSADSAASDRLELLDSTAAWQRAYARVRHTVDQLQGTRLRLGFMEQSAMAARIVQAFPATRR